MLYRSTLEPYEEHAAWIGEDYRMKSLLRDFDPFQNALQRLQELQFDLESSVSAAEPDRTSAIKRVYADGRRIKRSLDTAARSTKS